MKKLEGRSCHGMVGRNATRSLLVLHSCAVALVGLTTTTLASQPAAAFADITTDGAWCWFSDPRAITRSNRTYTGWITEDGSVQAAMLDHATGKIVVIDLHKNYERDDHDNPAFLFLPDGKLTNVQPIGADPRKFDPDSTEIYGVGAFLLAGSEIHRMAGGSDTGAAMGRPLPGYELVWADEFDGKALDTNKWIHWLSGKRRDATNTADAVAVSNGLLTITTYTEDDRHFTGMIATEGKFEPTYGYFEARIDFDDSPGMWSAFWMQTLTMGRPLGAPDKAGVEIDIVEHRSVDKEGRNINGCGIANLHWDGYGLSHKTLGSPLFGSDLGKGFHTYALEWTPDLMRFYVDQEEVWTVTHPVSRAREFLILSSEVDASAWAGKIPAEGYGSRESSLTRMVVDYVRAYQRNPSP